MAGSESTRRILIGTTNPSKFQSLSRRLTQFSGVTCVRPSALDVQLEVPEAGATMAENARLKARAFHRRTGLAVLGADSGLFFQDDPRDADFFRAFGFLMCSQPHEKRNPGWPLDSLSIDPYFRRYWFDIADSEYEIPELAPIRQLQAHFQARVAAFLEQFFRLQRKQPLESH